MKRLLLGSIILILFSISILILQFSCKKEVAAQTGSYILIPATATKLGGIIVGNS